MFSYMMLLMSCRSVVACEETVKKQYSLLGLEYRDTDSDDDINITGSGKMYIICKCTLGPYVSVDNCSAIFSQINWLILACLLFTFAGHTPPSPCESVNSETRVLHSSATNGLTPLIPKRRKNPLCLKEPVVILTRLPEGKISALRPRTPPKDHSRDESSQSSDSDVQWEPEEDSSDSDFFVSNYNTGTKKRRKIDVNPAKSHATPEASTNTEAKSNREKKSTPQFNAKDDATSSAAKTSAPQTNGNTSANSNGTETARPPGSTKGNVHKQHTIQKHKQPSGSETFFCITYLLSYCLCHGKNMNKKYGFQLIQSCSGHPPLLVTIVFSLLTNTVLLSGLQICILLYIVEAISSDNIG